MGERSERSLSEALRHVTDHVENMMEPEEQAEVNRLLREWRREAEETGRQPRNEVLANIFRDAVDELIEATSVVTVDDGTYLAFDDHEDQLAD